jgi:hypothetical protein
VIFWELFVFETWTVRLPPVKVFAMSCSHVLQSLLSGRPSLLNLRQINCRFPEDYESITYNGEVEIGCRYSLQLRPIRA